MVLPILEKATTRIILVTPFFQRSVIPSILFNPSKSFILGFLNFTSDKPANQPAAIVGLSDVMGAATNATSIDTGCAKASAAPC